MKNNLSQTNFQHQHPLYENEVQLPRNDTPEELVEKKPWFKQPKVLVGMGSGLLILIVLLIVLIPKNQGNQEPEILVDVEESVPSEKNPFLDRIVRLEEDLQAADPTKPELIFPPVDMSISLEEN